MSGVNSADTHQLGTRERRAVVIGQLEARGEDLDTGLFVTQHAKYALQLTGQPRQ
jgi:hypothetical protein